MSKLIIPATTKPPRFRNDGSVVLSFDTRELTPAEVMMVMGFRNTEGWLCYSPNEESLEIPEEPAEVEGKSQSERLRAVLWHYWKKKSDAGEFSGIFEAFKREHMEKFIDHVKSKLD